MPKNKKVEDSSDSDSGPDDKNPPKKITKVKNSSDSDSAPEIRNPPKKKQKLEKKSKTESAEDNSWSMGNKRFVKLTEFKGKWYVDIREFYENNGELKPGKRGIMLTMEQWQKFKGMVGEIDEAIKKNV